MSVRTQLVLLVLTILLPALFALGWFLAHEREESREQAYARIGQVRDNVARSLEAFLRDKEAVLSRLAARPRVRALDPKNCDPLILDYLDVHPEFVNLVLRDLEGNAICPALPDTPPAAGVRQLTWFEQAVRATGFRASDAVPGPVARQWSTVLSYPVRNEVGQVRGLLTLPVDLLRLQQQLLASAPNDVLVTVATHEGKVLLRSADAQVGIGQLAPAGDGVLSVLAFTRTAGSLWRVVAEVPESVALAESNRTIRNAVLASLALLTLALALAWRIGLRLVRPIAQLAQAVAKVTGGDTGARVAPLDGPREVISVANQFNRMLDARDQYEAALRESEAHSRALLAHLPVGVIVHGVDARILDSNPMAGTLLRQTAKQLRGKTATLAVCKLLRADGSVMPTTEYPVNVVLSTAQSVRDLIVGVVWSAHEPPAWVLCNAYPVLDGQGQITQGVVIFVDITARKRAQDEQQRVQERLQLILRGIDEAPWDSDLITGEVYFSPRWWQMLGYEADELPADLAQWERLRHPDEVRRVDETLAAALKGDAESFQIEHRLRHKQGHYMAVLSRGYILRNAQGQPLRLSGTNTDLTERKKSEANLRDSQSQYQELVEWSPVGLSVQQHGRIVYVNPAAVRLWGAVSADELVGTPIEARFHPLFRASALERIRAIIENGIHASLRQSRFLKLDGRAIDVETQGMPIQYRGEAAIQISFQDISARMQAENTLRESEARFRTLTQLSSDWYWEQDENFRFIMLSGQVAGSTGLTSQEHLGKTRWELPTLNLSEADWERHREVIHAHQEFRDFEIRRPDTNGLMRWASVSGAPMFDVKGVFRGYRGIGRDISAQKQAADQIHRLAFYDALTSLPNRRLLLDRLKKALQTNARHHMCGALLFIDLDNFKTLNDTLGHDVGDVLLQQVAARLVSCVRETDTVARLGGDEFVLVLEDLDEDELNAASQADVVGQKILTALNVPYQLAGREHRSSPSIGITLFGSPIQGVDDLLKQADLAMYQAKAAGRNTLRFFDVGMQSEVDSRVALESDLRDGLQGGEELLLHFQPILGIHGRVTGAEALVRWQQPRRGLVMPDEFIPLAETTGLILPLGRWVLRAACEQLALWARRPETAHLTLAVNVSARELREPGFVSQVKETLKRAEATPNRLRLELTESVLADRVEDIIVKMTELKALGVGFSLDDFGTGYSSLSYLKRLPLDLLKIDRSFVRDVLSDPNDAAIARTIIALGQSLGLSVVAEGVETEAQRAFLALNGCFAYQGYLFGRPMPIAQFEAFMTKLG